MMMKKLKNGSKLDFALVTRIMERLMLLKKNYPIQFNELVKCCRGQRCQLLAGTTFAIKKMALVETGNVISDDVKNIVLSAVEGDEMEMTFKSPYV